MNDKKTMENNLHPEFERGNEPYTGTPSYIVLLESDDETSPRRAKVYHFETQGGYASCVSETEEMVVLAYGTEVRQDENRETRLRCFQSVSPMPDDEYTEIPIENVKGVFTPEDLYDCI